jgi:hypothetical protein
MRRLIVIAAGLMIAAGQAVPAEATKVRPMLTFQADSTQATGSNYRFTFRLFDASSGGNQLWFEEKVYTIPSSRTINHRLGSVRYFTMGNSDTAPVPVDFSRQLWAEVQERSFVRRYKLEGVPYALWSDAAGPLRFTDGETSPNLVGGHAVNTVAPGVSGAVIAGGGKAAEPGNPALAEANEVIANFGGIVAGTGNKAGESAFIGGGVSNQAGGLTAAVLGGFMNQSGGESSSVTGGSGNLASGSHSSIPGGCSNKATEYGSLAAGEDAYASRWGTFVWSSSYNTDNGGSPAYDEDGGFPRPTINGEPNPLLADSQFWVRAQGGVFFVVGEDAAGNPIGVKLVDGTGWQPIVGTTAMAGPEAAAPGNLQAIETLHALVRDLQQRVEAQERQLAESRSGAAALSARLEDLQHRHAELRRILAGTSGASGDQARK